MQICGVRFGNCKSAGGKPQDAHLHFVLLVPQICGSTSRATSKACTLSSCLVKMNVVTGLKIVLAVFLWCVEAPYGGE